ncbi:MAG TPA: sugar phosphate isomerase/epimerase family protein [Saprospiraceae bacterium]|nr:sugar phosphate isomerase/epimerase family protein [Saprospiraceae bacterium]
MKQWIFIICLASMALASCKNEAAKTEAPKAELKLSLAEWSLHKTLFDGKMVNMQFAAKAKELGFTGIEYVNQFFKDKAENTAYLDSLNAAAKAAGITQVLIMIDGEGYLGEADSVRRDSAVNAHKKWVTAAKHLGCHSIRVNAHGEGTAEEVSANVVKGLTALSQFAAQHGINVIVENHGGYSSNGAWLAEVMKKVNLPNCGTLPDFGNFCLKREGGVMWGAPCTEEYDRYKGIEEILPFAKGVSAKSYDFDAEGNDTKIDYKKMLDLVKASGYTGFIGVEYEGEKDPEIDGIKKTKALIEKNW